MTELMKPITDAIIDKAVSPPTPFPLSIMLSNEANYLLRVALCFPLCCTQLSCTNIARDYDCYTVNVLRWSGAGVAVQLVEESDQLQQNGHATAI